MTDDTGRKRAGRPTKYNAQTQEKIANALSAGNTRKDSAAYAGISEDTFAIWLARYSDFSDAINKAEADAAVRNVAIIGKAAQAGTWQAAAWWLERRRKTDWAQRNEYTGADAGPVKVIVEYVDVE